MTLTVRTASVTGATTAYRALTHAEMDANWAHVISSANQSFVQSGTGAVSTTVSSELQGWVTPDQFGAVGDGSTDDTTAVSNANTRATSSGVVRFKAGKSYRITANTSISAACYFEKGATLTPDSGKTVTITGPVVALFGTFRAGSGSFSVTGEIAMLTANNFCVGTNAGDDLTTGIQNILIGSFAGRFLTDGADNIIIGTQALKTATSSSQNVIIGTTNGSNMSTADHATLIGYDTGTALTQGQQNTMVGHQCGKATTTGGSNVFVGRAAANSNITGGFNTAVGHAAGFQYTGGEGNTWIGNQAGNAQGASTPTTGDNNIAVGQLAGPTVTGVSGTLCIGSGDTAAASATVSAANTGKIGFGLTDITMSGREYATRTRQTNASAGAQTLSTANFLGPLLLRTGAGGPYSDTTPAASAIVAAIPGCEVGSGYVLAIRNTSGGIITILAGSGVTLSGTTTIGSGNTRLYNIEVTNVATPAVLMTGFLEATG